MRSETDLPQFNYCLIVAYDGRDYFGWQRLSDKSTIQGALETAIQSGCDETVVIQGAGRTDRGVHAEGQVAGFKSNKQFDPEELQEILNAQLPETIRIVDATEVPTSFHPRMSAIGKEYVYLIWNELEIPDQMKGRA